MISGGMFLASLALEVLPQSQTVQVAIDTLRKGAASLLLVTPVARLVVAGTMLGLRGEWRYTLYAAGVLGLLALAVGAGSRPDAKPVLTRAELHAARGEVREHVAHLRRLVGAALLLVERQHRLELRRAPRRRSCRW